MLIRSRAGVRPRTLGRSRVRAHWLLVCALLGLAPLVSVSAANAAPPGLSVTKFPSGNGQFAVFSATALGQASSNARNESNGTWWGWSNLGNATAATSTVVGAVRADGTMSAFYTETGVIYSATRNSSTGAWSGWVPIGAGITGRPAPVTDPVTGRFKVFAIGVDGNGVKNVAVMSQGENGVWSGWAHVGYPLPSQPLSDLTVAKSRSGVITVYYVGANRHFYSASVYANGTMSNFVDIGSEALEGTPAVIDYNWGKFAALAVGVDGNGKKYVAYKSLNDDGTWTSWSHVNGTPPSPPAGDVALARNEQDTITAYYVGTDKKLYSNTLQPNGTWWGWSTIGAPDAQGTPVAMAYGDGKFSAYVRGADNKVWSGTQLAGGGWTWASLGSPKLTTNAEYDRVRDHIRSLSDAAAAGYKAELTAEDLASVTNRANATMSSSVTYGGANWKVDTAAESDRLLRDFVGLTTPSDRSALLSRLGTASERSAVFVASDRAVLGAVESGVITAAGATSPVPEESWSELGISGPEATAASGSGSGISGCRSPNLHSQISLSVPQSGQSTPLRIGTSHLKVVYCWNQQKWKARPKVDRRSSWKGSWFEFLDGFEQLGWRVAYLPDNGDTWTWREITLPKAYRSQSGALVDTSSTAVGVWAEDVRFEQYFLLRRCEENSSEISAAITHGPASVGASAGNAYSGCPPKVKVWHVIRGVFDGGSETILRSQNNGVS